ncbi:Fe-S cluster assembly scaffold protein SufA [Candidatus Methylacidiphilum fumarolicum]|uniref:Fe-S cluster assembly scaffold protein SufA n=2 Tax=Candidatus Methylacidiphilum fumarolicum TaxID=591154 RepID=I0JYR2_METFB|nr:iron-sulfur cluster biosynthesis family protein [Candidatus Methylacidiphilum fumarolicum]MBW6415064.1 Fe-S cluster assembly scaffold protein SufA [Candidatus Methylacidiphilum fumarolicum]TFE69703.1 Fe-S cluster assembly scaffold protein SufA [Candidatus Methylacidiphilum fumarolicum]TFE74857.1 Fe-S cluster assembly scaffold protein SufA [Candidatus Methylacidiphilum fumarolicum]TFE75502.1 Fe-S cluster assembly scaffold protein SufA [Candidatus Methylacidiphilum fumarolicum]TFE77986.1 Fe-S
MKISITPKAKQFISRMIRMCGGTKSAGMRLIVGEGGCSGFTTDFSVVEEPQQSDTIWEDGVRLFIPKECLPYFEEAIVHFIETPTETRLIVLSGRKNNNSCGCSSLPPDHSNG